MSYSCSHMQSHILGSQFLATGSRTAKLQHFAPVGKMSHVSLPALPAPLSKPLCERKCVTLLVCLHYQECVWDYCRWFSQECSETHCSNTVDLFSWFLALSIYSYKNNNKKPKCVESDHYQLTTWYTRGELTQLSVACFLVLIWRYMHCRSQYFTMCWTDMLEVWVAVSKSQSKSTGLKTLKLYGSSWCSSL